MPWTPSARGLPEAPDRTNHLRSAGLWDSYDRRTFRLRREPLATRWLLESGCDRVGWPQVGLPPLLPRVLDEDLSVSGWRVAWREARSLLYDHAGLAAVVLARIAPEESEGPGQLTGRMSIAALVKRNGPTAATDLAIALARQHFIILDAAAQAINLPVNWNQL